MLALCEHPELLERFRVPRSHLTEHMARRLYDALTALVARGEHPTRLRVALAAGLRPGAFYALEDANFDPDLSWNRAVLCTLATRRALHLLARALDAAADGDPDAIPQVVARVRDLLARLDEVAA